MIVRNELGLKLFDVVTMGRSKYVVTGLLSDERVVLSTVESYIKNTSHVYSDGEWVTIKNLIDRKVNKFIKDRYRGVVIPVVIDQ